jgi:hypothetical protein
MTWPPMLLHLRFPAGADTWGLWLPLFLAYPIILAVMLLLSPFVLLAALVLWPAGKGRLVLLSGVYTWGVLFKLSGLKIDVEQGKRSMLLNFV